MHPQLDIPDLLLAFMEQAPAGFAIGLHIRFHSPTLMFQTYPVAWLEEYSREGLMMQDPIVTWGMSTTGETSWDALKDLDPQGVLQRAREHGMIHGFAVSLTRGGSYSLAGFARSDRDFTPEERETIRALLARLHDSTGAGTQLAPETRGALRSLSVAFTQP